MLDLDTADSQLIRHVLRPIIPPPPYNPAKVSGSYYADVEASCQLFHVCVQVSELEVRMGPCSLITSINHG